MVFAVVIDVGLAFPSVNVAQSPKRVIVYCRVPRAMAKGDWEPFNEPRWQQRESPGCRRAIAAVR